MQMLTLQPVNGMMIVFAIFLLPGVASATGMTGKLFCLTFMNISTNFWNHQESIQEIFVTSLTDGLVTIEYTFPLSHTEGIQLNADNDRRYVKTITPTDVATPFNRTTTSAIVVSSTMDISVHVSKAQAGTAGGYMALPITVNSTKFFLASYTPLKKYEAPATFSIISPFSDTTVTLQYINKNTVSTILNLTMSKNEVYQGMSMDLDYTGVYVTSDRPIAVFSGHTCAMIPESTPFCDHIIEQIPPVSQWGKTLIVASYHGRSYTDGYVIRVIAQSDITVTYTSYDTSNSPHNGEIRRVVSLRTGQWDEATFRAVDSPAVVLVNCTDDCLVVQYNPSFERSSGFRGLPEEALPDPFMVIVPSLEHYVNVARFSVSHQYRNQSQYECLNGITIMVKTSDLGKVHVDGKPITEIGGEGVSIPISAWTSYSVIIAPLGLGFHNVTSTNQDVKFAVFVYGFALNQDPMAYAYLGGYKYLYGDNDKPVLDRFNSPPPKPIELAIPTSDTRKIKENGSESEATFFALVSRVTISFCAKLTGLLMENKMVLLLVSVIISVLAAWISKSGNVASSKQRWLRSTSQFNKQFEIQSCRLEIQKYLQDSIEDSKYKSTLHTRIE